MSWKVGVLTLLVVAILGTTGCGPKLPYEVVKCSGTVTYQGQPVPGIPLFFVPQTGRPSNGFTDEKGRFSMIYTATKDGIQTGHGYFYFELSPGDGRLHNNEELLGTIAKKYGKGNELLKFEITKAEKNFELKLE